MLFKHIPKSSNVQEEGLAYSHILWRRDRIFHPGRNHGWCPVRATAGVKNEPLHQFDSRMTFYILRWTAHHRINGSFKNGKHGTWNSNRLLWNPAVVRKKIATTQKAVVFTQSFIFRWIFFRVGMQMNISAVGSTAGSNGNGNKPVECT